MKKAVDGADGGEMAADDGRSPDEGFIYDQIHLAVARQELPPGTRLREDQLRRIFGVSRARIRNVLTRLVYAGVVTLEPNRGASIARPSPKEAHDNFAARRAIEDMLVRSAAARFDTTHGDRLARSIDAERAAEQAGDTTAMVWLSGEFHVLIADISDNAILRQFLRELITREALVIAAYERPGKPSCSHEEHRRILDALAARDADLAARLMLKHLSNVEERLDLDASPKRAVDLAALFARDPSPKARARTSS